MNERQSNAQSTDRMQRATVNLNRQGVEHLMNLQRSMARLTLDAMQWQQTAQQQGMELTKSVLNQFPGQEFTQSMLEQYLEGMEAMMPEMERAMERGLQAGGQP